MRGKTPDYAEFLPQHRGRMRDQMQLIRTGDFVGVRYGITSPTAPFEIYNVALDPKEERNLASTEPALQQRMKDSVLRWRRPGGGVQRPYDRELIPGLAVGGTEAGVDWIGENSTFRATAYRNSLDGLITNVTLSRLSVSHRCSPTSTSPF